MDTQACLSYCAVVESRIPFIHLFSLINYFKKEELAVANSRFHCVKKGGSSSLDDEPAKVTLPCLMEGMNKTQEQWSPYSLRKRTFLFCSMMKLTMTLNKIHKMILTLYVYMLIFYIVKIKMHHSSHNSSSVVKFSEVVRLVISLPLSMRL